VGSAAEAVGSAAPSAGARPAQAETRGATVAAGRSQPARDDDEQATAGVLEFVRGLDCRDVLPHLPPAAFDACITDPPYGIGLAPWDVLPEPDLWAEVRRVLKPGAPLVAFAGRRTYHRLASAVEAAGFSIGDPAIWIFLTGRPPSKHHLRPAHEQILIAHAPGKPRPVNIDEARIPWRDEYDRAQVARIDSLRAHGVRRAVYKGSLTGYGREAFIAKDGGRWPTTVMTTEAGVLGGGSHVFMVPKLRRPAGHLCSKPPELLAQLVRLFVPVEGVVLDPFAGGGALGEVAVALGRKAVLIDSEPATSAAGAG
jgi:site-specific DNA-methyltransferase (adenine-specific)